MRPRTLTSLVVLALTVPASAGAVPDAVPETAILGGQAARGGGLIRSYAGSVTPTPKTVDGDISDWAGDITRYGGTAIYSRGEYVYQDYLMDDWGADDGQDWARVQYTDQLNSTEPRTYRLEALAQALGEQFGAGCGRTLCAVARYGDVDDRAIRSEADIEEVRVAADDDNLYFLVRTAGMTTDQSTAVQITIAGDHVLRFLAGGDRVDSYDFDGQGFVCQGACPGLAVATNSAGFTNAIEVSVERALAPEGSIQIGVATGLLDRSDGRNALKAVKKGDAKSDLLNVAFRFKEPQRIWMDHDQAFALRDGNIDKYLTAIDLDRLEGGYTESFEPRPGYWERIYVSDSPVNVEAESNSYFQGIFQHYGVYLPSSFRPGKSFPATWWTHYRGGHAHDAAAWLPGLLRQFGEAKGNIMIFPSARGTSSWYVGRGHEDFLEVWDDTMAALPIDPDQVYMTGYSMGGFASWFLPMVYPDRFAGASPQEGPPAIGLFVGIGGSSDPSNGQNGNDPQATHTYNIIENARNVPYVIYHGTDDELVPISGIVAAQKKFLDLGYRNRLYALDGNEHYTTAIIDVWTEAADYLNQFRRDPAPAHVTYRTWPALEYAVSTVATNTGVNLHYRFNKANWVSDLNVRGVTYPLETKPNPAAWGTIDVTSYGRGVDTNLGFPEAGAGHQGTPYEMTGLRWLRFSRIAPSNTFAATLTNLASARFDLARAGLSTGEVIGGSVTTDGSTELRLTGGWSETPQVLLCVQACLDATVDYDGTTLSFTVPDGNWRVFIAPPGTNISSF